jgi:hypothetical protein
VPVNRMQFAFPACALPRRERQASAGCSTAAPPESSRAGQTVKPGAIAPAEEMWRRARVDRERRQVHREGTRPLGATGFAAQRESLGGSICRCESADKRPLTPGPSPARGNLIYTSSQ